MKTNGTQNPRMMYEMNERKKMRIYMDEHAHTQHNTQQRTHHTEILMPIQYIKYNFWSVSFLMRRDAPVTSHAVSASLLIRVIAISRVMPAIIFLYLFFNSLCEKNHIKYSAIFYWKEKQKQKQIGILAII